VRAWRLLLTLALALVVSGGHAGLLQVTAWTAMLRSHLASEGVGAALSDTFDGKHPCALCCAAAALGEHQDPAAPAPSRADGAPQLPQALPMERLEIDAPTCVARTIPARLPAELAVGMRPAPPVPPPRSMA
jgi:hypothetical protein